MPKGEKQQRGNFFVFNLEKGEFSGKKRKSAQIG